METLVGGSETEAAREEGGTSRDKISEFVSKGEKIFVNMTNTLQEMSHHGKKLSAVAETVEKLQADLKAMKRKHESNKESTSKKRKMSDSDTSSDDDDDENINDTNNAADVAAIFSDRQSDNDGEEENDDFLQELDNQFKERLETGDKVSEKIAGFTNRGLRADPQEQVMKQLREKHKRPENLPNLQTPQVETFLWRELKLTTKLIDAKLQKSVHQLSDCLVPVIKALDHVRVSKTVDRELMKDLLSDTFNMMVHSITSTNKARRDKIIQEIHPTYKSICQKSVPSATQLFGDNLKEEAKAFSERAPQMTQGPKNPFLGKRGGGHSSKTKQHYRKPYNSGYSQQKPFYKHSRPQLPHKSQHFQKKDQQIQRK
ncbi:uncharacterized protein LOC132727218 [Ruditapes philippinarum]|uniref:uncharacterized protein LOC132727218 n=1 Tax=Ruditapes philippinarum TaxID=129788 RepID=UPI00295ABE06|nr:uncharacterized protein LOC132727218 [Ruditapes philippinarum]